MNAVSMAAQAGRKGSVQRLLAADPQWEALLFASAWVGFAGWRLQEIRPAKGGG